MTTTLRRSTFALATTFLSVAAHAGGAIEIPRTVDGVLAPGATPADVSSMLVSATWRHSNPDKEHSTWESKTLTFDATGSVDVSTMYAWGPRSTKVQWHVARAGRTPAVDINGVAYELAPCSHGPRTTCLVGGVLP